ncbi:MAG: hypothetical protein QW168_01860 [Sulfolobales archaeon]
MYAKLFTPGDIVAATGLPRYEVLAALHVLEELGIIELVISKGNYKVYRLTKLGEKLYKALELSESPLLSVELSAGAPQGENSSASLVTESSS